MTCLTLPRDYRYAATMDFMRNRRQLRAVAILSLCLVVLPLAAGLLLAPIGPTWALLMRRWPLWFALAGMLFAYIPLHEATHGLVMFALSGVRPTFGLRLPYAYAGSAAYFDRRGHVLTALAPVVVWGAVLGALAFALPREWFWILWAVQISNLSGSAGDLYCAWALMRMKGDLLIRDTGTRMTVYRKTTPSTEDRNA